VGIRLNLFRELNKNGREAVEAGVERHKRFFGVAAVIDGNLEPFKLLSPENDPRA